MPADVKVFNITRYQVQFHRTVVTINGKNYNRSALINCLGPNQSTDEVKWLNM